MTFCCHVCQQKWISTKHQPAVKEGCDACGAYLHCCLNCRFYAPHAHNKCAIPTTDWVGDRKGCNFCDEFTFAEAGTKKEKSSQAHEAFGQLFEDHADDLPAAGDGLDAFRKL